MKFKITGKLRTNIFRFLNLYLTFQPSPTKASIPDHLARALVEKIPLRKGEGKTGRPIQVFVNMMEIKFGQNFRTDVVHYDIVFNPETPRYLIRSAFQALQQEHFPTRHPAFDGRKNVFSAGRLPFGDTVRLICIYLEKTENVRYFV